MGIAIVGIIPARFGSTRFPGKPLAEINGNTMINRVYEQAVKSGKLQDVWVATDDKRIYDHVLGFGGKVTMTSEAHRTGTERCLEALEILEINGNKYDVVINIQGDEPFIDPAQINKVAGCFNNLAVEIATLRKKITESSDLFNPNIIKVTTDIFNKAICFSRSPIPFMRGKDENEWINSHDYYKHIGIYAYRSNVLKSLCKLPQSSLETAESLEQLRWIENGYRIYVETTEFESYSIDTPNDIKQFQK